jgi:molybdate transport system substrate-binding protein
MPETWSRRCSSRRRGSEPRRRLPTRPETTPGRCFCRIDAQRPGAFDTLSKKAQQLVGNPATPGTVNGRPRLLAALDDRQIDLFISYCSGARQIVRESSRYKSLDLPGEFSVGPEYGLTVSRKAAPGAADFAIYLLSPQGQSSLKSFGFIPVALPAEK